MAEYRVLHLLAISQLKNMWYFEIFTWESMGKFENVADCREKENLLLPEYRLFEFSLGSFSALCRIPDVKNDFQSSTPPSFHPS